METGVSPKDSKRAIASKVELPLSPVAYLIYARLSFIIICQALGKYKLELTIVRAMLKWKQPLPQYTFS